MKTINELQDEVIEEFSDFDDWMDKYQLLIDLGNDQQPLDPKYKTEQNLIDGCQSRVWLQADLVDGKVIFQAESDALIVKGIISLLIQVVSGHTPDEILESDLYFIEKIGLKEHLSPTRSNGLLAMVKQMRIPSYEKITIFGGDFRIIPIFAKNAFALMTLYLIR